MCVVPLKTHNFCNVKQRGAFGRANLTGRQTEMISRQSCDCLPLFVLNLTPTSTPHSKTWEWKSSNRSISRKSATRLCGCGNMQFLQISMCIYLIWLCLQFWVPKLSLSISFLVLSILLRNTTCEYYNISIKNQRGHINQISDRQGKPRISLWSKKN